MSERSKQLKLVIKNGIITAIHDDALTPMFSLGDVTIKRASHVEPDRNGHEWSADMRPVGGRIMRGFKTRGAALKAEVDYLRKYVIT
jgi:hypothetical protein